MKFKNIILGLVVVGGVFVTGCDGGGGDSSSSSANVSIPEDSDGAGDINEGEDVDASGADESLESAYGEDIYLGINSRRSNAGLSGLIRDADLDALAEDHNQYMISQATAYGVIRTGHDNYEDRVDSTTSYGYTVGFGENTGGIRGYSSAVVADTFINNWVSSSGHYQNIIGDFTHTGVAVSVDSRDGTIYATQIFVK